jgi:ubiquinone/menaquinone biosynthesis methyltransferase
MQTTENLSTGNKTQVPLEFNRVAKSYDWLTGLNPGYKRHLAMSAKRMDLADNARILDLCCGTGLSTAALKKTYPSASITALDFSAGMLERAKKKKNLAGVRFVHGDATDPGRFGIEGPFDAIYMAYGIRNIPKPDLCLANLRALLKPGGKLCIHEYSVADSAMSQLVWNAVTLWIVIPSGRVFAGRSDIFRYLRRSVLEFDGVQMFEERLRAAGFEEIRTLPMDGWQRGIVHTFLARAKR